MVPCAIFFMEEIYGIVPPMVTPFTADEKVDETALQTDVNYLIATVNFQYKIYEFAEGSGQTSVTVS